MDNLKHLFSRLFNTKGTSARKTSTTNSVTQTELQEMLLSTRNRVRGLNSTVKQYTAMEDSVERGRKKHYANLKNAAQLLLTKELKELETLKIFERRLTTS